MWTYSCISYWPNCFLKHCIGPEFFQLPIFCNYLTQCRVVQPNVPPFQAHILQSFLGLNLQESYLKRCKQFTFQTTFDNKINNKTNYNFIISLKCWQIGFCTFQKCRNLFARLVPWTCTLDQVGWARTNEIITSSIVHWTGIGNLTVAATVTCHLYPS